MDANKSLVPPAFPPRYKETTLLEDLVSRWLHPPHACRSFPGSFSQRPQLPHLKVEERHCGFGPRPHLGGYWSYPSTVGAGTAENSHGARCLHWSIADSLAHAARPARSIRSPHAICLFPSSEMIGVFHLPASLGLCFYSFIPLCNVI